ncbi:MFS transporter [Gynuella sp.]|uniref:MFS transporter n=1 Tax=Gynuella sp. TaxID=2969146 RepID=UPI003D1098D0
MTDIAAPKIRTKKQLRKTLNISQKEAVASAAMTATSDNFLNPLAIFFQANALQMSWLTAFPQLIGALSQLLSVWLGSVLPRRPLVYVTAFIQTAVVMMIAALALINPSTAMYWLLMLAILYHSSTNIIQPHWRAWMGQLVPARRRGTFFAARTRLTMATSVLIFLGGGAFLSLSEKSGLSWLGFAALFAIAGIGRFCSSRYLYLMHDPAAKLIKSPTIVSGTFKQMLSSMQDKDFRNYSFFIAGMQGMVAISAPYFSVYMLRDLQFSYFDFAINSIVSILTQFITLKFWGKVSDRFGNHLVITITSMMIMMLPLLWLGSPSKLYLIGVQIMAGLGWSGFTLSTANYLYDIRPHRSNFATYAAVQSAIAATLVFCGALLGGWVAELSANSTYLQEHLRSTLLMVFCASSLMRVLVVIWFLPKLAEPKIRHRPEVLQLVLRVSRFNAISGMVMDWLTVTSKKKDQKKNNK